MNLHYNRLITEVINSQPEIYYWIKPKRSERWKKSVIEMAERPTYNELKRRVRELEKEATELRKTGEQVKQQSEFLSSVLESLSHPFYVIDAHDYSIMLANSSAQFGSLTGESTCYALTHKRQTPCDSTEHPCPLKIIKRTKKPVVVEHIHFDKVGTPRNVEVHGYPIFDNEGNVSQMIEYTFDITDRKQMDEALKESESKFRSVAQSANDAIISSDKNGHIVFWNSAAQRMFGYTESEIMGRPLTDLMPQNFRQAHQRGLSTYPSKSESRIIGKTVEMVGLTKEGMKFPIELSVSSWNTGKDIFFAGIIRDISERKQFEKERDRLILDLQSSLAKVKTLSGLLPICASCKKIRDDKGYWNQIEGYIHKHSDATFSHGICPECTEKLYPDFYPKKESN
jgi:PAS domain S-box-containing protein